MRIRTPLFLPLLVDHEIRTKIDFFWLIRIKFLTVYYSTLFYAIRNRYSVSSTFFRIIVSCVVLLRCFFLFIKFTTVKKVIHSLSLKILKYVLCSYDVQIFFTLFQRLLQIWRNKCHMLKSELFSDLKGSVSWDRFQQCWRKLTGLGRVWFLKFSEAPLIFGWNKTSSFR